MPLFDQLPATVKDAPFPPCKIAPSVMARSPESTQSAEGVTPAGCVLAIRTEFRPGVPPTSVMRPLPPKTTVPELANEPPPSVRVTAAEGAKARVPLLDTRPVLRKLPPKV